MNKKKWYSRYGINWHDGLENLGSTLLVTGFMFLGIPSLLEKNPYQDPLWIIPPAIVFFSGMLCYIITAIYYLFFKK